MLIKNDILSKVLIISIIIEAIMVNPITYKLLKLRMIMIIQPLRWAKLAAR